jgi:hypothetical protein
MLQMLQARFLSRFVASPHQDFIFGPPISSIIAVDPEFFAGGFEIPGR